MFQYLALILIKVKTKELTCSSDDGYQTLSSMLPKFEDEGKFDLKNLGCDTTNLYEYLISNNAVYHKSCYSRYNQQMLNRITEKKE